MTGKKIKVYPSISEACKALAEAVIDVAQNSIAKSGRFTLVLSGGDTPQTLYNMLAGEYRARMPWLETHFFFGDERLVPMDSVDSNYRLANECMFTKAEVPKRNIHPVPTWLGFEKAAQAYEDELRRFLLH